MVASTFFGMLDMTIVNSYVLYKESNKESFPLLDFRRELALGLLTLGINPNRPGPGAPKDVNLHSVCLC